MTKLQSKELKEFPMFIVSPKLVEVIKTPPSRLHSKL